MGARLTRQNSLYGESTQMPKRTWTLKRGSSDHKRFTRETANCNPYYLFLRDFHNRHLDLDAVATLEKGQQEWERLPKKQKLHYINMAIKARKSMGPLQRAMERRLYRCQPGGDKKNSTPANRRSGVHKQAADQFCSRCHKHITETPKVTVKRRKAKQTTYDSFDNVSATDDDDNDIEHMDLDDDDDDDDDELD